jgi:MFS transporter, ACS family, glucarate transporter
MPSPRPAHDPAPQIDTGDQKPTHARYWVVVFALTLAVLSYIDRVALSQAAPRVQRDLGLTDRQMGYIFSAFGLAYATFEIPGGFLGDWLGPKKVLIRIVLWWSFFTAALGQMWNFWSLWTAQILFGAGEAGCFPNLTKAFTTWLPLEERVRTQGFMWTLARWGGAFTPILVVTAFGFMSWRTAFLCFGSLGLIWAALFWWWFKDDPSKHPGVNAGELQLLTRVKGLAGSHADVPWRKILRSRTVWLLWGQYFCSSFAWYFFITFQPKYLQEFRHLTEKQSAQFGIVPLLFGGLGSLFSGLMAARLAVWTGSVRRSRRMLSCVGFAGAAVCWTAVMYLDDPLYAVLAMGLASFSNDLNMPGAWGTCMDIGGKYAGTVSGSMNMMGNLAGFAMPMLGGIILQATHRNYNILITTMVGFYVLGAFLWPFIDPVTPLEIAEPGH